MKVKADHSNPTMVVTGFTCPSCKTLIRFPFQELLMQHLIICTQCSLELHIDQSKSATALEGLSKYMEGIRAAERILDGSRPG